MVFRGNDDRLGDHAWDQNDAEAEAILRIVNILEKTSLPGIEILDAATRGRVLWYLNQRYAGDLALVTGD